MRERLEWIRKKLELSRKYVCESLKIPVPTFNSWEEGARPVDMMRIYRLAEFYNEAWLEKFGEDKPLFKEYPVHKITLEFLITGKNQTLEQCELEKLELINTYEEKLEDIKCRMNSFNAIIINPPPKLH